MERIWKPILVSALCAALLGSSTARADDLTPPNDDDIKALDDAITALWDSRVPSACAQQNMKPYLDSAAAYLNAMNKWLGAAVLARAAHLKSIEAEQDSARQRASDIDFVINLQNALLLAAKLSTDLSALTQAMTELADVTAPSPALQSMTKAFPDEFERSALDKLKAAKEALIEGKSTLESFTTALSTRPPLPQDKSIFSARGQELTDKIQEQLPPTINSMQDLIAAATKLKEQFDAVSDIAGIANAAQFRDLRAPILAIGEAIARIRQGTLMDELQELQAIASALDPVWQQGQNEITRLTAREWAATRTIKHTRDLPPIDTCEIAVPCTPEANPPQGLAFGGTPWPSPSGVTYGVALRTFTAATTHKYADAITAEAKKNGRNDTPSLTLTDAKTSYKFGESVRFTLHRGNTCVDPLASVLGPFGVHLRAGPFHTDQQGAFSPGVPGTWMGQLFVGRSPPLEFSFTVMKGEPPQMCGITVSIMNDSKGHLPPRVLPFSVGTPGNTGYVRGSFNVMPGISCEKGTMSIWIFGGVSRKSEYFARETDESVPPVGPLYPDQWVRSAKVTFDVGETTTITAHRASFDVKVPENAKRLTHVELNVLPLYGPGIWKTLVWSSD